MPHVSSLADQPAPTVLVVEDEVFVRMPIAEYLRDCGFRVLEAGTAVEAIELVDAGDSVDLMFSDVRIPGEMDGLGLARWMRGHHPEVSVLLTSGYTAPDTAGLHGVRLIEKPYSQAQVLDRIHDLIFRGTTPS